MTTHESTSCFTGHGVGCGEAPVLHRVPHTELGTYIWIMGGSITRAHHTTLQVHMYIHTEMMSIPSTVLQGEYLPT